MAQKKLRKEIDELEKTKERQLDKKEKSSKKAAELGSPENAMWRTLNAFAGKEKARDMEKSVQTRANWAEEDSENASKEFKRASATQSTKYKELKKLEDANKHKWKGSM